MCTAVGTEQPEWLLLELTVEKEHSQFIRSLQLQDFFHFKDQEFFCYTH